MLQVDDILCFEESVNLFMTLAEGREADAVKLLHVLEGSKVDAKLALKIALHSIAVRQG